MYTFPLDAVSCNSTHVLFLVTTGAALIELAESPSPSGPYHTTMGLEESPCTVFIAQQFKLTTFGFSVVFVLTVIFSILMEIALSGTTHVQDNKQI